MTYDRWPQRGAILMDARAANAKDWMNNACTNWCRGDWYAYVDGYLTIARDVGARLLKREGTLDTLVYPLVFSWRQFLELSLKEFIFQHSGSLAGHEHHDLKRLWTAAAVAINARRDDIRAFGGDMLDEDLDEALEAVADLIDQFHAVDAGSFAFRYPREKRTGAPSLPPHLTHLNVRLLHEEMNKIATFLGDMRTAIDETDYANAEIASAYD
jgi:hypothetical protein